MSEATVINTEPFIDLTIVTGSSTKINLKNELHRQSIRNYFIKELGFKRNLKTSKFAFESPSGFRTVHVRFEKQKGGKKGTLVMLDFPGSYMYGDPQLRMNEIRNFSETVFEKLEIDGGYHFSQMDLTIDRLGATFETHGYCLNSKDYKIIHTRSKRFSPKVQAFHNNPDDLSEQTGQRIKNSRMWWRTYAKLLQIAQELQSEEYQYYREYYEEKFKGHNRVLREEIKMKGDFLDSINAMFWGLGFPINRIIKESLTRFGELYKIIDIKTGKPVKDLEDLFNFGYYTTKKEIFKEIGMAPPTKSMKYSDIKKDPDGLYKDLANHFLALEKFNIKDFIGAAFKLRKEMPRAIDRHIMNLNDRLKTELVMTPKKLHKDIKERYTKEIEEALEHKKRFPENIDIIKKELKDAIDSLTERDAFLK